MAALPAWPTIPLAVVVLIPAILLGVVIGTAWRSRR
jgi:hypothetical protein